MGLGFGGGGGAAPGPSGGGSTGGGGKGGGTYPGKIKGKLTGKTILTGSAGETVAMTYEQSEYAKRIRQWLLEAGGTLL